LRFNRIKIGKTLSWDVDLTKSKIIIAALSLTAIAYLFRNPQQATALNGEEKFNVGKPILPEVWPSIEDPSQPYRIATREGTSRNLTIDPRLQKHLELFLRERQVPIASVVMVDVATGKILAMAQGRNPDQWNSKEHTAIYNQFPAASLFKTIVTAAAIEVAGTDPQETQVLWGGCGNVNRSGVWLRDDSAGRGHRINLRTGYGRSCNGLFAKLAVNTLGLNAISIYAKKFGWENLPDADFALNLGKISVPDPRTSSVHTIGRFAAGFGDVGLSPVHAAWFTLAIANDGVARPLQLFQETQVAQNIAPRRVVEAETAHTIMDVMDATTNGGTASYAFRRPKYRKLKSIVGGKTGTLTGRAPKGVTTWFAGVMPIEQPRVVVVSLVILDQLWHVKAPDLAAEALWAYEDLMSGPESRLAAKYGQPPENALKN
jgi:peptidoglycan glycosyltransferase